MHHQNYLIRNKLRFCLKTKQFFYQKMGYLLWQHKEQMGLSDSFFEKCKKQIGKSKRYLTRDQDGGCYDNTWKLVVPNDCL